MCFVIQNHLGKGDAALSRFIPLADGALRGLSTVQNLHTIKTYRRFTNRNGSLRAPLTTPSTKGDVALPLNPSQDLGDMPFPPAPNPCIYGWPFNRHLGKYISAPKNPMMILSRPSASPEASLIKVSFKIFSLFLKLKFL